MNIKVFKTDDRVTLPMYGSEKPIIYFYALEGFRLLPEYPENIRTGIKIRVPEGYILELNSVNILNLGTNISIYNSPLYITEFDFNKELIIPLIWNGNYNHSLETTWNGRLKLDGYAGKPIAKGILKKVERPEIIEVDEEEFNTTYISS